MELTTTSPVLHPILPVHPTVNSKWRAVSCALRCSFAPLANPRRSLPILGSAMFVRRNRRGLQTGGNQVVQVNHSDGALVVIDNGENSSWLVAVSHDLQSAHGFFVGEDDRGMGIHDVADSQRKNVLFGF